MLFHGSKIKGIKVLKPNFSMHGKEYVYLSTLRSVALIYTVNSIEKYYDDNKLNKPTEFHNWYAYGFSDNKPYLDEYYPNAIKETYSGVSGYIYTCEEPSDLSNPTNIFCARVSENEVKTNSMEYIEDVYEEFLKLEKEGLIELKRYEDKTSSMLDFINDMIKEDIIKYDLVNRKEYNYSVFLRAKFPKLFEQG